jgi:hypothetical protein
MPCTASTAARSFTSRPKGWARAGRMAARERAREGLFGGRRGARRNSGSNRSATSSSHRRLFTLGVRSRWAAVEDRGAVRSASCIYSRNVRWSSSYSLSQVSTASRFLGARQEHQSGVVAWRPVDSCAQQRVREVGERPRLSRARRAVCRQRQRRLRYQIQLYVHIIAYRPGVAIGGHPRPWWLRNRQRSDG